MPRRSVPLHRANSPPPAATVSSLAVAYMDLGDKDTARGLLLEVAATGDAATRAEAADLLDRLA